MKEIRGKHKKKYSSLPKALKIKQGIIKNESQIAKNLRYFTIVGNALVS